MNTTTHAAERAFSRISDAGLSGAKVLEAAEAVAKKVPCASAAVLMTTLPETQGEFWVESNGSQVWAIVRGGRVATLMLRRTDQPSTAEAMRVDRVFRFNATPKES